MRSEKMCLQDWWGKLWVGNHCEKLGIDGKVLLNFMFK
jgi:hypothetical protein